VTHTSGLTHSDWSGQFDPTSPSLTPRPNPHRTGGTDSAPPSRDFVPWRFSDAGPPSVWRGLVIAGVRKPAHEPTSVKTDAAQDPTGYNVGQVRREVRWAEKKSVNLKQVCLLSSI
jgi:hypothetical protein